MLAAGWLMAGGTAAAAAPVFPTSLQREPVLAWLKQQTNITPDRVLAVTPQGVMAIVSSTPPSKGHGPRVVLRTEVLNMETYTRTTALSWQVSVVSDCTTGRVQNGETTGYAQRNLAGPGRSLRPAEIDWRMPEKGSGMEAAWLAACDPNFKGPFGNALNVAQAGGPAPVAEAAPPPTKAPTVPAKAPPVAAPAKAAAVPSPARATSGLVAQVGSSISEADAKGLLTKLGPAAAGHPTRLEKAEVDGKTWYRAVVGGFAGPGDAAKFCATLKSAGRACFVRAGRSG